MRWFHKPSGRLMVATPTMRDELEQHGFHNITAWSRGVDTIQFHPRREGEPDVYAGLKRPIFLSVGRVAVEKNIEAFLSLDLPGTKVVVGDGPQKEELEQKYPDAVFTGARFGDELAAHFACADVFVFPSLTDTELQDSGCSIGCSPSPADLRRMEGQPFPSVSATCLEGGAAMAAG